MARTRHAKKVRYTRWEGLQQTFAGRAAGTAGANIISAASDPQTLLRTRGELVCSLDGTQAPGALIAVGVGLILVPEGTGTSVLWSPISDPNAPWFYYSQFVLGYEEMVTDVVDTAGFPLVRLTIDSKAMRIQRSDVEIQMVVENVTLGSAAEVTLAVTGRMLFGVA